VSSSASRRVHDERKAPTPAQLKCARGNSYLLRARAVFIIVVETGFAYADDLRVSRQSQQRHSIVERLLFGLMRMDADRAIDVGESVRPPRRPRRSPRDACRSRRTRRRQPPSRAATTSDSSGRNSGKSRWQWLSTSIGKKLTYKAARRAAIARAAETIVWRGSRCNAAERTKLARMRLHNSTQRSRCGAPSRARARIRAASICVR